MSKKPLPTPKVLEYSITLPISQTKTTYRPYNVADERILLAAATSKDEDAEFYVNNTLNVIQSVITNDVNASTLPALDVRFLLLHQRAKAVGEIIEFTYDGKKVATNIESFRVDGIRGKDDYKIDVGGGIGVLMCDLNFEDEIKAATAAAKDQNKADVFYHILFSSVKAIYNEEDVWMVGEDITKEEMIDFIGKISGNESKKLYEFVTNSPKIVADIVVDGKTVTISDRDVDFLSSQQAT